VFYILLLELVREDALITIDTKLQPKNKIIKYKVKAILDKRLVGR
jgi:hypothetical protein